MTTIPDYIEHCIRRPPPPNSSVVQGSTPVLSFGDAQRATVASLGLNPSRIEFLDQHRNELTGESRRLATHTSLGTSDLVTAPMKIVAKVLEDCKGYFHRNPYRRWFDQLMPILNACGASYYDECFMTNIRRTHRPRLVDGAFLFLDVRLLRFCAKSRYANSWRRFCDRDTKMIAGGRHVIGSRKPL